MNPDIEKRIAEILDLYSKNDWKIKHGEVTPFSQSDIRGMMLGFIRGLLG